MSFSYTCLWASCKRKCIKMCKYIYNMYEVFYKAFKLIVSLT